MIKIVSLDIVDLLPFASGVLFVLKDRKEDGSARVSFYSFDAESKSIATVTKSAYLLTKFGSAFNTISKQLGDYISCDAARLWNNDTMVIYSTGETGIFDEKGTLKKTGEIKYRGSAARDVAPENNFIWSVVPEQNLIVKYSTLQDRVVMRIGSEKSDTFSKPVSIEKYDDVLYVCNEGDCKIKKINLADNDFSVEDYKVFTRPVYKYLKVAGNEFAVLADGVYML